MESKKLLNTIFLLAITLSFLATFAACTGEEAVNPTELSETGGETAPEETTYPEFIIEVTLDDGGRIYETMPNYVFIRDDEAMGVWQAVDIVYDTDDFTPGAQIYNGDFFWYKTVFFGDGKILIWFESFERPIFTIAETWTKGYILTNDKFTMKYTTKKIDNDIFLFIEDKPMFRNIDQPPIYRVFKKTSEKPEMMFDGYEDVRNADLSFADFSNYPEHIIATFMFNDKTIFPPKDKMPDTDIFQPEYILEAGKNPGLGVRSIHEQGITGKGVSVAIIDFPMFYEHPEYKDKIIVEYTDELRSFYHGPLVTSLLVGENIGTAPGATVYYYGTNAGNVNDIEQADAAVYAEMLDMIIEKNKTLPEGEKIRVVSVSAAPTPQNDGVRGSWPNGEKYLESVERAREAGILVLDASVENGIIGGCEYSNRGDREDVALCSIFDPGWGKREILAPMMSRTAAEVYQEGDFLYSYSYNGGLSSAIPYAAGVLAMGWQIRPELTADEMLQALIDTAHIGKDGDKFIYPTAFIEYLQKGIE